MTDEIHDKMEQYVRKQIDSYMAKYDWSKWVMAAKIAKETGLTEKVEEICSLGLKETEKAYKTKESFLYAAEFSEIAGLTEKAIDLYFKAECFVGAAKVAEEAGQTERAMKIYEEDSKFLLATEVAKKLGLTDKVIELYKKESDREHDKDSSIPLVQAARYAKKEGLTEKAEELYIKAIERGKSWSGLKRGVEIAEEAEMLEKVVDMYIKEITHVEEIQGYQHCDDCFKEQFYRIMKAAEIAEKVDFTEKAMALYCYAFDFLERESKKVEDLSWIFRHSPDKDIKKTMDSIKEKIQELKEK